MGQQPSKERARLQVVKDEMDKTTMLLIHTQDTWVVDYHLQLHKERMAILACLGAFPTCAPALMWQCCVAAAAWLAGRCLL